MKKVSANYLNDQTKNDPIRRPWVIIGLLVLLILAIPVWPLEGNWWGIPAWSVMALLVSLLTSFFTAFVIYWAWNENGESE